MADTLNVIFTRTLPLAVDDDVICAIFEKFVHCLHTWHKRADWFVNIKFIIGFADIALADAGLKILPLIGGGISDEFPQITRLEYEPPNSCLCLSANFVNRLRSWR